MFLDDLNQTDRSNMYLNFDSSIGMYGGITDAYIGIYFPEDSILYFMDNQNYDGNPVTATIMGQTGTSNDFSATPRQIRFTMTQIGFDWYISELWLDPHGTIIN